MFSIKRIMASFMSASGLLFAIVTGDTHSFIWMIPAIALTCLALAITE